MTGGATGIGFGLAKRFIALGHQVIITGRRQQQLDLAKQSLPSLITLQGDIETDAGRLKLFETVSKQHPNVNVLINNAGVGFDLPALKDTTPNDWKNHKSILAINLEAPIHLSTLFLNHLLAKPQSSIVNVSSGLAFFPFAPYSTYSASKAGLHSFSLSLRQQVKGTTMEVVEVAPPAVLTDLCPATLKPFAADLDVFTDNVVGQILEGKKEIGGTKTADGLLRASRDMLDIAFDKVNGNKPPAKK